MPARTGGQRSNLRTDDMERWRVELRMTLDREHRRFHKANEIDYFEELLKAKIAARSQGEPQEHGLSLNLSRLDEAAFTKLNGFLKTFMGQCPSAEQQNKLHKVLRDLLIDLKQELYKQSGSNCLDPYCLFCGTTIQAREPIAAAPCYQLQQHSYTPNVASAAVSTPPPSAAPTPDEGVLNHSMQRLQSQFNNSFVRRDSANRPATPPMSAGAVAALRLRQNQEARRALDEAKRAATSRPNASPTGLVNLDKQPNNDQEEDDELEQAEVASVRDIVCEVDRVLSSPKRGQQRSSTPLSSSDESSDLVMDLAADFSASQTSEPNTPPVKHTRIKKMREAIHNPRPGPKRTKKGGPKRKDSQRATKH